MCIRDRGSVSFQYSFVKKRNHIRNTYSPNQGYGLDLLIKKASSGIMGRFDYSKVELDSYKNSKIGPFSLFSRLRLESIEGDYPNQELLGIFDIPNFYIAGVSTPGREYMSPRGYVKRPVREYKTGTKAMMTILELRTPALPISIFEALKIFRIGMPSLVVFTDIGNAWTNVFRGDESIATSGAEIRLSFNIISEPLFIFSYGRALNTENLFKENPYKLGSEPYLQLSLVNPF